MSSSSQDLREGERRWGKREGKREGGEEREEKEGEGKRQEENKSLQVVRYSWVAE